MSDPAPAAHTTPILIIGLGNPILGDDGVGWRVAEEVNAFLQKDPERSKLPQLEIDTLSVGGLGLMERMVGYDHVILIDAMLTGEAEPGTVTKHHLNDLPNRAWGHLTSSHDTTLQNALEVGRRMDSHIPECIQIIAIEAENKFVFSEDLSPPVANAVPLAVEEVLKLLHKLPGP